MEMEKTLQEIREVVSRAVVGKGEAVDLILTALLCGGHVLIEDVPGVGKTTLVRALAAALGAPCFALGEEDVQAVHCAGRIVYGGGLYAGGVAGLCRAKKYFPGKDVFSVHCGAGPGAAAGGAR